MRWQAWGLIPCIASIALLPLSNSNETTLLDECARRTPACSSHTRLVRYADELRSQPDATIILNHWRRPVENLRGQLRAGLANGIPVWVCIFGSPHADEYVEEIRQVQAAHPSGHLVRLVFSDVDLGVQGRFQVALGVKTRFLYIVDDDVMFPATAIEQYETYAVRQRGIYGLNGHVRGASEETARWVEGPTKPASGLCLRGMVLGDRMATRFFSGAPRHYSDWGGHALKLHSTQVSRRGNFCSPLQT
mmetsp:Transcript_114583/g.262960  ORF Transcript_114583/g.262960 Transcript_114583/m.262960 type:complete len:248 (+) Transcript_114583:23-766(+)